ncbi:DNA cytosine methyltransferase [Streptomyces sp. AC495_CC817]|uniref:DNA cytosine methyltransferase n=1 Tax=Streptomyces sp. AC495_CC817 TaxID=2823900 RepID=UPI001C27BD70|nr:DNA cytosine methyltransferase [Streptomyces sp. AC495_CC817]
MPDTVHDQIRSGELFAGVGGLGMAVDEVFGSRPAWFAEFDDAPSKVLAHRYPGITNYGDVTKIDFRTVPHTQIRAGGFPCQDVSLAGRRRGLAGGTRSGLWSEFLRSIEEDRPDWVVIENVRGLLSADGEPWHADLVEADQEVKRCNRIIKLIQKRMEKWSYDTAYVVRKRGELVRITRQRKWALARFKRERRLVQRAIAIVLRGLADLGFDAEWAGLRAADVGAPHGRFRVFILAWPQERTVTDTGHRSGHGERARSGSALGGRPTTDDDSAGLGSVGRQGGVVERHPDGRGRAGETPRNLTLLPTPAVVMNDGESVESWSARRERIKATGINGNGMGMPLPIAVQLLPTPDAYSGSRGGSQHPEKRRDGGHTVSLADVAEHVTDWGPYAAAISRWEQVIGRPAPAPVRFDGKGGKPRLNPELTEWMMGWPMGWVTASVIGLSRAEQLKACGNGVVPQQAAAALRILLARPGVPALDWELAA